MQRNRRMVLMDRLIPFLAAFVGLVALGGAVLVQVASDARNQRIADDLSAVRASLDELNKRTDQLAATDKQLALADQDGTVDGLLALQERMQKLEDEWASQPLTTASASSQGGAYAPSLGGEPAAIDPKWPTEDCIPLGTRFMASVGDEMAICKTPVKIKVSAITADNVMVDGAGVITETAFKPIAGTNCTLMVFSADEAGFAEMRVSCQ